MGMVARVSRSVFKGYSLGEIGEFRALVALISKRHDRCIAVAVCVVDFKLKFIKWNSDIERTVECSLILEMNILLKSVFQRFRLGCPKIRVLNCEIYSIFISLF